MAIDTPKNVRNLVLYEIYVRNHGANGTFADVTADLPRIREMGVDVVWFMPIHPIGQLNKKGTLGCPYSIQDYFEVNPEYGTKREFELLVQYAHALGLKVMIDVVYNHTAHDAVTVQTHPEWYHRDANGRPVTTVPEWSDIIDLVYDDPALWDYLIDALKMWVELGVDGFRCDVASAVPLAFWQKARQEILAIQPDVIWPLWERAVAEPTAVSAYLTALWYQKGIYPAHTVKLRCVENHDQQRIMKRAPSRAQALAWTAFQAFNEGPFLLYAGQESEETHTPDLFDMDKIRWGGYELQSYLKKLCQLKKDPALLDGRFTLLMPQPAISALWRAENEGLFGVFNVSGVVDVQSTPLPDGEYLDVLSETAVTVRDGEMAVPDTAVILRFSGVLDDVGPQIWL